MVKTKGVYFRKFKNNKSGENKITRIAALAAVFLSSFFNKIKN